MTVLADLIALRDKRLAIEKGVVKKIAGGETVSNVELDTLKVVHSEIGELNGVIRRYVSGKRG